MTAFRSCFAAALHWADCHNGFLTAIASIVIALFTVMLFLVAHTQNRIQELNSAPHIAIGNLTLDREHQLVIVPFSNTGQWGAHFLNPNHLIAKPGSMRVTGANLPLVQMRPRCDLSASDNLSLEHGDGYQWTVPVDRSLLDGVLADKQDLWVVGCAAYADELANRYTTPICRYFNVTNKQFFSCVFSGPPK